MEINQMACTAIIKNCMLVKDERPNQMAFHFGRNQNTVIYSYTLFNSFFLKDFKQYSDHVQVMCLNNFSDNAGSRYQ